MDDDVFGPCETVASGDGLTLAFTGMIRLYARPPKIPITHKGDTRVNGTNVQDAPHPALSPPVGGRINWAVCLGNERSVSADRR